MGVATKIKGAMKDATAVLDRPSLRPSVLATREARHLADLHGIIDDLGKVVTRCSEMRRPGLSDEVRAALWESILVTYYRCFTSGSDDRRQIEPGHLALLCECHQETHAVLERERHHLIAHRDDEDAEFHIVTGFEDIDRHGSTRIGIAVVRNPVPSVEPSAARELAMALIDLLGPVYELEYDKLLNSVQQLDD